MSRRPGVQNLISIVADQNPGLGHMLSPPAFTYGGLVCRCTHREGSGRAGDRARRIRDDTAEGGPIVLQKKCRWGGSNSRRGINLSKHRALRIVFS